MKINNVFKSSLLTMMLLPIISSFISCNQGNKKLNIGELTFLDSKVGSTSSHASIYLEPNYIETDYHIFAVITEDEKICIDNSRFLESKNVVIKAKNNDRIYQTKFGSFSVATPGEYQLDFNYDPLLEGQKLAVVVSYLDVNPNGYSIFDVNLVRNNKYTVFSYTGNAGAPCIFTGSEYIDPDFEPIIFGQVITYNEQHKAIYKDYCAPLIRHEAGHNSYYSTNFYNDYIENSQAQLFVFLKLNNLDERGSLIEFSNIANRNSENISNHLQFGESTYYLVQYLDNNKTYTSCAWDDQSMFSTKVLLPSKVMDADTLNNLATSYNPITGLVESYKPDPTTKKVLIEYTNIDSENILNLSHLFSGETYLSDAQASSGTIKITDTEFANKLALFSRSKEEGAVYNFDFTASGAKPTKFFNLNISFTLDLTFLLRFHINLEYKIDGEEETRTTGTTLYCDECTSFIKLAEDGNSHATFTNETILEKCGMDASKVTINKLWIDILEVVVGQFDSKNTPEIAIAIVF